MHNKYTYPLGRYQRPTPPTAAEVAQRLAPFYMYTVEKFGVDRVMFASNFPMVRREKT